ncbi:hypothetical protein [Secundilactobacillus muriivasis]
MALDAEFFKAYLLGYLKRETGMDVGVDEISSEAVELYRDELDQRLLPPDYNLDELPESFVAYTYMIKTYMLFALSTADLGSAYLFGIANNNQLIWWHLPEEDE